VSRSLLAILLSIITLPAFSQDGASEVAPPAAPAALYQLRLAQFEKAEDAQSMADALTGVGTLAVQSRQGGFVLLNGPYDSHEAAAIAHERLHSDEGIMIEAIEHRAKQPASVEVGAIGDADQAASITEQLRAAGLPEPTAVVLPGEHRLRWVCDDLLVAAARRDQLLQAGYPSIIEPLAPAPPVLTVASEPAPAVEAASAAVEP
jgi:hypothetical protein